MTPPDAMSWGEAVRVIERELDGWEDGSAPYNRLRSALAAIQSHRVQADARVKALEVAGRDVIVAFEELDKHRGAIDIMPRAKCQQSMCGLKAALSAAANNDGAQG